MQSTKSSAPRPPRARRRLLALAAGAVAAILLAEIGYRLLRQPRLSPTTNPSYVRHDTELGWSYEPSSSARHATDEFDVAITIHAGGFRGREWTDRPDARRALLLGDSFAFGWGVGDGDVVDARIEELLPAWQVRNAAVSGYGTGQEWLLLRRLLATWRPDAVVCVFCVNDLWENVAPTSYGRPKPWFDVQDGRPRIHGSPVPEPSLLEHSALWRAWLKSRDDARRSALARERAAEWETACALLRSMRDDLMGVPLVVVSDQDLLLRLCREEPGLHHVDLRAVFADLGPAAAYPRDGHWTPAGHAALARALAEVLPALVP